MEDDFEGGDEMTLPGFWGLVVEPGKAYSQEVDATFHLTMAALDAELPKSAKRTTLTISVGGQKFALCSLIPNTIEQVALNHIIREGEEISFSVSGNCPIHLTGFYLPENDDDDDDDDLDYDGAFDDEDDEDEDEDEDDDDLNDSRITELEEDDGEDGEDDEEEEEEDEAPQKDAGKRKAPEKNLPPAKKQAVEGDSKKPQAQQPKKEQQQQQPKKEQQQQQPKKEQQQQPKKEQQQQPKKEQQQQQPKKEQQQPKEQAKKEETQQQKGKDSTTKKTLPNGLVIEDIKVGDGKQAKKGNSVQVRYTGRLANGTVFDSNTKGQPFKFVLGKSEVIKGWDLGVEGMAIGGERKLTIPPALAYGSQGSPPTIPKNAQLTFVVKLLGVN